MGLTLTEHPATTVAGIVNNVFAGFEKTEIKFKREDLQIISISQGSGNKVRANITLDLTSLLSVGDSVYLFAQGDSGAFTYDQSGLITAITATTITIDIDYVENASSGYINYQLNYFVEMQIVDAANPLIKLLNFSLIDDGSPAGIVVFNLSIVNDLNKQIFSHSNAELTDSRVRFNVQYREVYTGSSNSFILINNPIILVYATETPEVEKFINKFVPPKIYLGYESGVIFNHSNQNDGDSEEAVQVSYDELDINKAALTTGNILFSFNIDFYGFLYTVIDKFLSLNVNTQFLKFKAVLTDLPDYDPAGYSGDYDIT